MIYRALLQKIEENKLRIALERYDDALLKHGTLEERFALVVAGLDALLGELGESRYKLSVRVAKLLSQLHNAKEVRDDLRKAYIIRSQVAHGSEVPKKYRHELRRLLDRVLEYLRKSILIFLLADIKPSELATLVEDSIVDDSSYEELKRVVNRIKTLT